MIKIKAKTIFFILFFCVSFFSSGSLFANESNDETQPNKQVVTENPEKNSNNLLDRLIIEYKIASGKWKPPLQNAAEKMFWSLALIEITWTFVGLALKQADMSQFVAEIVRRILFISFFMLLLKFGSTWAAAIIESFMQLGKATNSVAVSEVGASDIFDMGLLYVSKMLTNTDWLNPINSLGVFIAAIVLMVCFSLIAALIVITQIEMYVVLNAAVILLGFGASRWTSDYAKSYITYALSVGVKLMTILLLASIGHSVVGEWMVHIEIVTLMESITLIGACIVYCSLLWSIPKILSALVKGVNVGSDDALMKTTSMATSAATGGAMVASTVSKVGATSGISGAGMASAVMGGIGVAKTGGASGFQGMAKSASGAIFSAGKQMAGEKLNSAVSSTFGGKLGSKLNQMEKELNPSKD